MLSVVAGSGCSPFGVVRDCEVPEPACSTRAEEAAGWAAMARPGVPIERIRVLADGGYEIHYADGLVEAAVP